MVTKGGSGIFAKMAQLVRPSGAAEEAPDSVQSELQDFSHSDLRARIEGKRRDDQVRRREFNHLRQIRASAGLGGIGMLAPSTFQVSSGFNPDDLTPTARAHTLRKIDQIEAYMGEHLRQKRLATSQVPLNPTPSRPEPPVLRQTLTPPPPPAAAPAPADAADDAPASEMDLDFTAYLAEAPAPAAAPVTTVPAPLHVEAQISALNSSYSESRLESQELGVDDPALQDAAIRFAEGDVAGAESALLAVVQDAAADAATAERCASALLCLYRASDQSAAFDVIAIEFAQRFGRSAPEWYSIPDLLRKASPAHAPTPAPGAAAWVCPPLLTEQGVAQLAAKQQGPVRQVEWGALQSLAPQAVPALGQLLTRWAEQPVALRFGGVAALLSVLESSTVTGERATDPACWMLRLEVLRITGAHEAFENVALDYCITYELSPPSWLETDCTYRAIAPDAESGSDAAAEAPPAFVDSRAPDGPELHGNLLGDAHAQLDRLLQRSHVPGEPLVVHCQRLLRVDFAAVGSMLNWLTERHNEGVEIQFVQVPRLVAVFFQMMGITEYASVAMTTR